MVLISKIGTVALPNIYIISLLAQIMPAMLLLSTMLATSATVGAVASYTKILCVKFSQLGTLISSCGVVKVITSPIPQLLVKLKIIYYIIFINSVNHKYLLFAKVEIKIE